MRLVFGNDNVRAIYDDRLKPIVKDLGVMTVVRASHVEPTPDGGWSVDLSPSGGPTFLARFDTRQEALDAEVQWLTENVF